MVVERLWVAKTPIRPGHVEDIANEGSRSCSDQVVIGVVAEVGNNVGRDRVPIGWAGGHDPVVARCTHRPRIDLLGGTHIGDRIVWVRATVEGDIEPALCVSSTQGREEMPASRTTIDVDGATLDATEASSGKALQEDVPKGMQTYIIPDNTDSPACIADGDTWEVVHGEAVIAWNERARQ